MGRLSWSHIQGNSGLSYAILRVRSHFPSLPPLPSDISSFPLLLPKSVTSFLSASVAPCLFLLQKPGGGADVSCHTQRMRVLQWSAGGRICPEDPNSTSSLTPKRSFPQVPPEAACCRRWQTGTINPVTPPRLLPLGALSASLHLPSACHPPPTYPQCSGSAALPAGLEKAG